MNSKYKRWLTDSVLWAKLRPMAREMRAEPTEAEDLLWQHLRNHQLLGFKFRRQHSIERFIVDFYCSEVGLVVEIEGPIHQYREEEDLIRKEYITSQGLRLVRFSNNDVLNNVNGVINHITSLLSLPNAREVESYN